MFTDSQTERAKLKHLLTEEKQSTICAEAALKAELERHFETKHSLRCLQDLTKELTVLISNPNRRPAESGGEGTTDLVVTTSKSEYMVDRIGELEEGVGRVEAAMKLRDFGFQELKGMIQAQSNDNASEKEPPIGLGLRFGRAQSNPLNYV